MKAQWYRGHTKYDRDPNNNYSDGYGAGRRWYDKYAKHSLRVRLLLGILIGEILVIAAYLLGRLI